MYQMLCHSGDLTTITSQEVITASKMGEHTLTCEVTADKETESCEVKYSIGEHVRYVLGL